jgi:hypothetical protein
MSNNVSFSIDAIREAVFAIETELGISPKSVYKDVRTRLDVIENRVRVVADTQQQLYGTVSVSKEGVLVEDKVHSFNFEGEISVEKTGNEHVTISVNPAVVASFKFSANCPEELTVGNLVYITGPAINGLFQVDKVDITDISKMPAIGVVIEKMSPLVCSVLTLGESDSIDLLIPNSQYFVGLDGNLTNTPPTPLNVPIFIQSVGVAIDDNKLLFQPSFNLTQIKPSFFARIF